MNSFAWQYIDKYVDALTCFTCKRWMPTVRESKYFRLIFRMNFPIYVSIIGCVLSIIFLFVLDSDCKKMEAIFSGLFGSFFVTLLMELGNNYRNNLRCEIERRGYHLDLREFDAALEYEVMMADDDFVQGMWNCVYGLPNKILGHFQNKSYLFNDIEYRCFEDIDVRYLEVVKAVGICIEEQNSKVISSTNEDNGVFEDISFYSERAREILCTRKLLKNMTDDGYTISQETFLWDIPVSPQVRMHRSRWSKKIASKLISINCKFLYEDFKKLLECDKMWKYR